MPLVSETKTVDVRKLISLRNLLVRKVTWFVLTTTSTTLILSRAFGANCMTRIAYIYFHLPRNHSLTFWLTETAPPLSLFHILIFRDSALSFFISTSRNSLILPVRKTQFNTCNMGAHTFSNLYLSCSAFSVRLVPASNTASESSSNPERETTNMGEEKFLLEHIVIFLYIDTSHEILTQHIFYSLQDTFHI